MKALIGYNGFIGSNLKKKIKFQKLYNSLNINEINDHFFEEVYCTAPHGVKFWANKNPKKDKKIILDLIENLKKVKCNKFIHISTLDVYPHGKKLDESYNVFKAKTNFYGENRKLIEKFIIGNFKKHLIVRLPALFGKGLKKNALFDLLNNKKIKTNSQSIFQWYNLEYLSKHINIIKKKKINIINLISEPLSFKDIINFLKKKNINTFSDKNISFTYEKPLKYNLYTKYSSTLKKNGRYIFSKEEILEQLKNFIINYKKNV